MATSEQQTQPTLRVEEAPGAAEFSLVGVPPTHSGVARAFEAPVPRSDRKLNADIGEGLARSARRDGVRRRLLAAADVLAAATAFLLAVPVLGHDSLGIGSVVAVAMVILICKVAGLYDRDELLLNKTTLDEAPAIFRVASLYTLFALLAGGTAVAGSLGRGQAVFLWLALFVLLVGFRAVARRLAPLLVDGERCLIIGSADTADRLATQIDRCVGTEAEIVGRLDWAGEGGDGAVPLLGEFAALRQVLHEHRIDRAVIAPGAEDSDRRQLETIRVVKSLGVRISVVPNLLEAVGAAYEFDAIEGSILLGLRRHGLSRSSALLKRWFDLATATLLVVLLAPLLAMIAVAIKLDSRGPVIFRQRRVGRGDEVFEIFKFRSMIDGADAQRAALDHRNEAGGGLFKIEDDPRVTRVGRFLRRTSLDELAQLGNVLRGEMSLVGPRPLVLSEDSLIEGTERHRLLLPPGVTGLWQILGSARIPLDEMVKIDYLYGANWSLWLDLKILLRTIPFAMARRGL
jgi:exopolysaccharide biosynthesis polyprenyl glycosylphosphotransferase